MRRVMCLSNFTDRNSFAETVCTPLKPHSDWQNLIGFCSQDSHEEPAFCREVANELLQVNSARVNCKLFIDSDSRCSLQSPQIEFGKYHFMEEKQDRHQSLIRPFTLISTRENMRNR